MGRGFRVSGEFPKKGDPGGTSIRKGGNSLVEGQLEGMSCEGGQKLTARRAIFTLVKGSAASELVACHPNQARKQSQ
jgi:hypothetical protein